MLTKLEIENFRVFEKRVELRLQPITVLIGRNSAGKSSIIKFLLMVQQSVDSATPYFLNPEGDRVHLGTFRDQKNSLSKQRSLKSTLTIKTANLPSAVERQMLDEYRRKVVPTKNVKNLIQNIQSGSDLRKYSARDVAEYDITSNVNYGRKVQSGSHQVIGRIDGREFLKEASGNLNEARILKFPRPSSDDAHKLVLSYAMDAFLEPLRYEIGAWRHLSPVREESERTIVAASPPSDDVGKSGEYALPHLQAILEEDGDRAHFVRNHIKAVVDIDQVTFRSAMEGYLAHARARNLRTGARSYLSEFGFGASQCIPIIIQGAIMHPEHLLMAEQPEAQLHPSAQLELGSFFADLWTERKVYSLIETHSSNIILRLRSLIADPNVPLKPEDVSIGFVDLNRDRKAVIRNLSIDEDGNLEKGLPMEFFGADVLESMQMGLKSGQPHE